MFASARFRVSVGLVVVVASCQTALLAAARPSARDALVLTPIQDDVEFETPTGAELESCQIESKNAAGISGWIVSTAGGKLLRRFLDSNSDNKVDLWCYFNNGIEVYRDVDSDYNGKADQYRWLGTAGIRWGLDRDEDGTIDAWKMISAEEVTAEVVAALRDQDAARFERLLLTGDELGTLGLDDDRQRELEQAIEKATHGFAELARGQRLVGAGSKWIHFGGHRPGVVPAGAGGGSRDLIVYENVAAVVETDGKHAQVGVGTMIRVGENWRLVDLPASIQDGQASTATGMFFQAPLVQPPNAPETGTSGLSDEAQKLLADFQKIDEQLASARTPQQVQSLNGSRADLLERLIESAKTADDRSNWIRQFADTVGPAAQAGEFPEGTRRLATLYQRLEKSSADKALLGYVRYRFLTAEYGLSLQQPKADFAKIQEQWLKDLADFVADYPGSEDAPDAMLQLALAQEFAGKEAEAAGWYKRIVSEHGASDLAKKAAGALRRLDAVGKSISLRGPTLDGQTVDLDRYRGRVVLIHYWSTWCEPCKQDMTVLRKMQAKYGRQGFELIGVNLDNEKQTAADFLRSSRLPWPQIFEPGGLDSRLANELGILTLPTMILIDKRGAVVSRNIHAGELDSELGKQLR